MEKTPLTEKHPCQVALVVRNIKTSISFFKNLLGVPVSGPFLTAPGKSAKVIYRTKQTNARAKLAFLKLGKLELELIEPVGTPSVWQESLKKNGEGLHHIAYTVKGMDSVIGKLEKRGMSLVQHGQYPGGRYAYLAKSGQTGFYVELCEDLVKEKKRTKKQGPALWN